MLALLIAALLTAEDEAPLPKNVVVADLGLPIALGGGVQNHSGRFPVGPGLERFYPRVDANVGSAF